MSDYYYLMAQLPAVLSGHPPPMSFEEFREIANRFLSEGDKAVLNALSLEPPRTPRVTPSPLVNAWMDFERALRLSLERLRSARMKRDITLSIEETERISANARADGIARTAVSLDNPLEAEIFLNKARFLAVEELRGNHFFDSEAVFAYGLMVLFLERGERFAVEAGRTSYTTIYNQILGEEA